MFFVVLHTLLSVVVYVCVVCKLVQCMCQCELVCLCLCACGLIGMCVCVPIIMSVCLSLWCVHVFLLGRGVRVHV